MAVLLERRERALRRVDGQEREVGASEPLQLRVEIGEVAALQQRVVGEIDAGNDVLRAERDLFGLREEVVDDAVEHEPSDTPDGHELFGNDLRRIEDVEVELVREGVVEELDAEFPLREVARLDRVPEVAPVKVRVGAVELHGLVPHDRLQAEFRLPMELDERRGARGVHESERMDPEPLHEPERPRDRPVGHHPHEHVGRLGHEGDEVPEVVVRGLSLREAAVGLLLRSMDEVGEFDRVLDEEHGNVVADEIPVPRLGIELHGEAPDVTRQIGGTLVPGDGREADERRCPLAGPLEEVSAGDVGERFVVLEEAVRAEAPGVDDTFRNAFVVEVEDLLAKVLILQQARPARAGSESVLVVGDRRTLLCGQSIPVLRDLMRFAAVADVVVVHIFLRAERVERGLPESARAETTSTARLAGATDGNAVANAAPPRRRAHAMLVLGIILLVLGFLFSIPILWTLGIILAIIGAVLWIAEGSGATWGRRWY